MLVQPMVPAIAAGVAFTADPVTGDRDQAVVTAVRGVAERLVGGESAGDQWRVIGLAATAERVVEDAVTADQAMAVATLARDVERLLGVPQDVESRAIEPAEPLDLAHSDVCGWRLALLQARPMTALPDPVTWTAPGPGVWHGLVAWASGCPSQSPRCSPTGCCPCSRPATWTACETRPEP